MNILIISLEIAQLSVREPEQSMSESWEERDITCPNMEKILPKGTLTDITNTAEKELADQNRVALRTR